MRKLCGATNSEKSCCSAVKSAQEAGETRGVQSVITCSFAFGNPTMKRSRLFGSIL